MIHVPADIFTKIGGGSGLEPTTVCGEHSAVYHSATPARPNFILISKGIYRYITNYILTVTQHFIGSLTTEQVLQRREVTPPISQSVQSALDGQIYVQKYAHCTQFIILG